MLRETRRIGGERGVTNLAVCQSSAETLPFASGALDLVSCRMAANHFGDFNGALGESRRVLKERGVLVMADGVAPEDDYVADWMNWIELRLSPTTVIPPLLGNLIQFAPARASSRCNCSVWRHWFENVIPSAGSGRRPRRSAAEAENLKWHV